MSNSSNLTDRPTDLAPNSGPVVRPIADGRDWRVAEYICSAGPGNRSFEEKHETFTIAPVVAGGFRYQADAGTSLLYPGTVLLGNHGACFSCGHDHSRGDRCIAFHLNPDYFAEVAASSGGTAKYRFTATMLPVGAASSLWLARAQSTLARGDGLEIDEAISDFIETMISATSGVTPTLQKISAADERRISSALGFLECKMSAPVDLDQLAAVAAMSKYHFIRTFRRVVSVTPYQYLLGLRLRHAAVRLATSSNRITEIALEAGFGDLSTFVAHFRRRFGESPSRYRNKERRLRAVAKQSS